MSRIPTILASDHHQDKDIRQTTFGIDKRQDKDTTFGSRYFWHRQDKDTFGIDKLLLDHHQDKDIGIILASTNAG